MKTEYGKEIIPMSNIKDLRVFEIFKRYNFFSFEEYPDGKMLFEVDIALIEKGLIEFSSTKYEKIGFKIVGEGHINLTSAGLGWIFVVVDWLAPEIDKLQLLKADGRE
ncbi:hypothetical protein [Emticicia agri]|uniref:Uncharacterized protein n=1 Tax=Emticicia agri TaxID=2492393 RepID=A0A4Q5LXU7_9BACT|nr:hypothetical protein [Emticicia agri]RYU94343.1 hypothetical protein EWM59_17615 [Emticicia agri]